MNWIDSIHHDGSSRYVQTARSGEPRLGENITIRLRMHPTAPIERILLRTCPDGEQHFVEMQRENFGGSRASVCQWWCATLRLTMPVVGYRFLLFGSEGVWWYNGSGLHRHTPTDAEDFRLLADYAALAWVRDAVFYQIFPDRFADGDSETNPRTGEFAYRDHPIRARRWGEPPATQGFEQVLEFYGGDLVGIEQHLDYLTDLGVNALYLNPIFTAYSNHRYDVVDYFNVDPHLGGNEALIALRRATAERGLRLILDIVPNHCGVLHPWFQSALADPNAATAEYFTFHTHPDDYACWLGVRHLPKLNYRSTALRGAMYAGRDSVFRYWLRPPYAIDGWRIDVANMLGRQGEHQLGGEIGQGIRHAVKAENPEAYLLGENFFDSSLQLQGDNWDATMNYAGFAMPVWYWLGGYYVNQHGTPDFVASNAAWPTQSLVDTWQAYRAALPWVIARQQFNLLGSHDVKRILAHVGGDAARNRLAVGLQMTYVGVPSVYYGDEIGLGHAASDTRACMLWNPDEWDHDLCEFYRRLINLRRTSPALIEGGFQVLEVEADTLAYLRDTDREQIIVVGNRGPNTRPAKPLPVAQGGIPDGTEFVELFSNTPATVVNGQLPLPALPVGVTIWKTPGKYQD